MDTAGTTGTPAFRAALTYPVRPSKSMVFAGRSVHVVVADREDDHHAARAQRFVRVLVVGVDGGKESTPRTSER
jgi:hypothetical protein